MKNIYIFLIILLFTIVNLHSQIMITIEEGPRTHILQDSIFQVYANPIVPKLLIDNQGFLGEYTYKRFYILCELIIDVNNKVYSIKKFPIYDLDNTLPKDHFIWKEILISIDSVSKIWIFKPLHYNIREEYSDEDKLYYSEVNQGLKEPARRPFGRLYKMQLLINFDIGVDDYLVDLFYSIMWFPNWENKK